MTEVSILDPEALNQHLHDTNPQDILRWALERYENIALSFSGAEDGILIDMACKVRPGIHVFSLDTGRLHPQTLEYLEVMRTTYPIALELLSPQAEAVQQLVRNKGLYSFRDHGHAECCGVRKVEPLRRRLTTLDAWITGQRHDQNPQTRSDVPLVQNDENFSSPGHKLVKINPLANWTSTRVWNYIHEHQIPYNALHKQGYISIGCAPCTRPVLPNQHEREGRWWWEDASKKECGLHSAQGHV